ncbi:hypothetical protein [Dongshaea marina]|uniref:hypothetical protein n=1 Tax=Dongshaea marina TaxID=2047966 RepID=UPI000D3E2737|nr:hypothetical protein [Dongshaea marina]
MKTHSCALMVSMLLLASKAYGLSCNWHSPEIRFGMPDILQIENSGLSSLGRAYISCAGGKPGDRVYYSIHLGNNGRQLHQLKTPQGRLDYYLARVNQPTVAITALRGVMILDGNGYGRSSFTPLIAVIPKQQVNGFGHYQAALPYTLYYGMDPKDPDLQ